ncbi:hypothetical protein X12_003531 [Xanthomonas arboricola]|uniref:hypothetical protein n=1 Tax=Xanthomonas arboricola TaxID=56448 RepID=UPI002B32369F|nr:hypothetical protein X12_003531 [Xanthomonas arboricola]
MASVNIHAGDFPKGKATLMFGVLSLPWQMGDGLTAKSISLSDLESVDIATEESVKRLGGTIGWGVVGATLLGPVGLLAGLLAGGRKTEVTFVAKLKDGRKFLGSSDSSTYKKIAAATF